MSPETTPVPWPRLIAVGVALAAVLSVVLLAFSWPAVTAEPHGLRLAVVGPTPAIADLTAGLQQNTEGAFDLVEADDRASAVDLIEGREAYGAILLGANPEVLVASAASPVVAQQLGGVADLLTAQRAAASPEGAAPTPIAVTDVVPLAESDARGAELSSAVFPLIIGGILGGVVISLVVAGAARRLTALGIYAIVAGPAVAGIVQGWFGALQGSYPVNAAAISLAVVAIAAPIVGLASALGRRGIALGVVTVLLLENPIASVALPLEFLPTPWGPVGQWLPPGAAATLLRDLSYFPAANTLFPWLVLAGWAAVGIALVLVARSRATHIGMSHGTTAVAKPATA